jgi:hypothetical protein
MLTQRELRSFLDYNPDTGVFRWKRGKRGKPVVGAVAGSAKGSGYVYIGLHGKAYLAHRLAWLYVHGYFPENCIDHINRNPADNRIENLRVVGMMCNLRNTGNRRNNTSGVKGVYRCGKTGKWYAQVMVAGKTHTVGRARSFNEAVCYRLAAEQCLGWSGCDDNSPAKRYVSKMLKQKPTAAKPRVNEAEGYR